MPDRERMLGDFWRALTARWFITMSGPVGVPAALTGVFATRGIIQAGCAATPLVALLFTAYWIWRTERLKVLELEQALDPKLSLSFDPHRRPFVTPTTLTGAIVGLDGVLYVRVLPKCNAQITNCRGVLVRVLKLNNGAWNSTAFCEAHNLVWSNFPDPRDRSIRLDPGVDQCLDVFRILQFTQTIDVPLLGGMTPNSALNVFAGGGTYRFDVMVAGDNNARASISLKVTTGRTWNSPEIEVVSDASAQSRVARDEKPV